MNNYAGALRITGWLVIGVGFIGSFYLGDNLRIDYGYNVSLCVIGIISSVIFGIILLGLSEIIIILDNSLSCLKNLTEKADVIAENSNKNSNLETYTNYGYNSTPDYNNYDLPDL